MDEDEDEDEERAACFFTLRDFDFHDPIRFTLPGGLGCRDPGSAAPSWRSEDDIVVDRFWDEPGFGGGGGGGGGRGYGVWSGIGLAESLPLLKRENGASERGGGTGTCTVKVGKRGDERRERVAVGGGEGKRRE